MTNYTVQQGDTLESISRARFGTDEAADLIRTANPGIAAVPVAGTSLIIPGRELPRPPLNATPEQLSVSVGGRVLEGWTDVSFTRSMDAFGAFQLSTVWDPSNADLRQALRPFTYPEVAIHEGGTLLYTGTLLAPTPSQTANSQTVNLTGYSLPGVLVDCTPPIGALPLERVDLNLQQIAEELLRPFGLVVQFDTEAGPAFEREAMKPTEKILQYMIGLAKQRQILITDTPEGSCRFQTEVPAGSPVAVLTEGEPGIDEITPNFSPQAYYSHVTSQAPAQFAFLASNAGTAYTVANGRLPDVLRPLTFQAADTNAGDAKVAAEAKAGRMFANAVSYSAGVPDWVVPVTGKLWEPNTTIRVTAPGAMIYRPYEFLIRSVSYRRTATRKTAVLDLVLPGTFRGEVPEVLPWDE